MLLLYVETFWSQHLHLHGVPARRLQCHRGELEAICRSGWLNFGRTEYHQRYAQSRLLRYGCSLGGDVPPHLPSNFRSKVDPHH